MRFELTVALKYLIPKWRQLSVSIISLISICVISLVVWLVVLFLSVTEGIKKKWIEELVALNAPVRMTPTDAYYQSYYYQIDSASAASNYTTKTIGEKLTSILSDPYDPRVDMELYFNFPSPDRYEDGNLKDIAKEGIEAVRRLSYKGIRPQEYEVGFGNLGLSVFREADSLEGTQQSFISQVSYVASRDMENKRVNQMMLPPRAEDYHNLLKTIFHVTERDDSSDNGSFFTQATTHLNDHLKLFFENLEIKELKTTNAGFILHPTLFPNAGRMKGIGMIRHGQIIKVVVPKQIEELGLLEQKLLSFGFKTTEVNLVFDEEQLHISSPEILPIAPDITVVLDENIPFEAVLLSDSINDARDFSSLEFQIKGVVQRLPISGKVLGQHLEIARAELKESTKCSESFWIYYMKDGKCQTPGIEVFDLLGEGLLVAKQFQKSGVRLGDRGYLSYYSLVGSSMQEQRIPVYVAGFYDPGMIPMGNKLIFADSKVITTLRNNTAISDPMLGNGINIWLDNLNDAAGLKEELVKSLSARGIERYWTVQSYHDYELTRPILDQLQSDKNLFTLIALIILIVACSNIISMLILLVNDKKKEIGILQSMGASPLRIATIFGLCGFATGLISCILGVAAAILTLKNLQSLISFLSFLQGRDTFQTAFYGTSLPNELSYSVLCLVLLATLCISLLAGVIPAIKASKIRPTQILRSE